MGPFETQINSRLTEIESEISKLRNENRSVLEAARQLCIEFDQARINSDRESWTYDVILPNFYFVNVYHLEAPDTEERKRWVNENATLSNLIFLPRTRAYEFEIHTIDFAEDHYKETLQLSVDGEICHWHSTAENRYKATIPPSRSGNKLYFEVRIPEEHRAPDKYVSFSFRTVSIKPA